MTRRITVITEEMGKVLDNKCIYEMESGDMIRNDRLLLCIGINFHGRAFIIHYEYNPIHFEITVGGGLTETMIPYKKYYINIGQTCEVFNKKKKNRFIIDVK